MISTYTLNESAVNSAFKAYDIRGKVPSELNEDLMVAFALALVSEYRPKKVIMGRDVRESGIALKNRLRVELLKYGVLVDNIGACGTEEIYYATASYDYDLGIMFTASHNPKEYNGIKIVSAGAIPIGGDSGLFKLRDRILKKDFLLPEIQKTQAITHPEEREQLIKRVYRENYLDFLAKNFDSTILKNYKIVMNPGNGSAGVVLPDLLKRFDADCILVNAEPDGSFPNGVPNPLLPERRKFTSDAVKEHKADIGIAWDGDFDRCFFFDAEGNFVESYYLIGILAEDILSRNPGGKILHDTRLYWNTQDVVAKNGGEAILGRTGHAYMKAQMRQHNCIFGGEMSAHFYFKDFYYCDSGMLPWIKLLACMHKKQKSLAELIADCSKAYPCSGELNFTVSDATQVETAVYEHFKNTQVEENRLDGLSLNFKDWRFNLRSSNTEPLMRLNVESRANKKLMEEKTAELSEIIKKFSV